MYSEESIGWYATDNFVKDRMIDNSLMHKFASSSKILKRTKTLNIKIKKCGAIDYKHYVKLKTNIIRSLVDDTDNDISDILSDTDYSVICKSLIEDKDSVDDSKTYISTEEDVKKPTNTKSKEKINSKNTKGSTPKEKLSQAKRDTSVSKKHINISWQKVTKKNKDTSHLSNNQSCINEEDTFKNNNDYLKAQANNQSLSQQFDSQNSTSSVTKSISKNMNESCIDSSTMISEFSSSQDSAIFKIKSDESEIENYKEQNAVASKSNTELNSQNAPDSLKYQASSLKSINLENIKDSDNEISTVIKAGNTRNREKIKLAEADNKNLINSKNYSNTYESQKSKLLKNVRRNLMPVLEDDLMNNDKDIKKDKNKEDNLNDDQLLVPVASSTWHSTPKKTSAKGSEFDKNLQDKFDKIEQSDIKNSTNSDITEMVFPQQFEKIAHIETTASKNSKEDINNILETQKEKFSEEKNCSQLNSIKDINQEVLLTDQENEVKAVENIGKQQSSPKENNTKNVHSKSCKILEKQNREKEFSKGKIINSPQLNEVDKDAEINLTKHGNKNDLLNEFLRSDKKENSVESKNSCNIQKQQMLFSKKDHAKNVHLKSCDDNSKEQDEPFEKEIAGVLQSNQIDKNTEIYSINQDKTNSAKLQDSCNIQKQQVKITCSEIIDKKYTIINKQDNNVSIEKNDINSQEEVSKAKEIENNITSDTEEDDANDLSPENKRLQQQKRLNLVMSSDSSQSEDEYIVIETSKNHEKNNDSDISCCNKDTFKNNVTDYEKINTDISCSKEAIISTKEKEDSPNVKKEMKNQAKTALLTNCTNENNNSCVEESKNEISSRNKTGLFDKENFCDKSSQNEDRMSELGIRCKSRHEQNKESTKFSNVHLDISCHYRPYNVKNFLYFFLNSLF